MSRQRQAELEQALGIEPMDRHHARFVALLEELAAASDDSFAGCFARLRHETQKHFDQEQALMEQSAYPARHEHADEHQRILGELTQFQRRAERGLAAFARSYVRDSLTGWFPLHLTTMDAALAAHLKSD